MYPDELNRRWIDALLTPEAYPHATATLCLIETHISWVVLTGPFAYKIKKPVKLGFLDFSTLARRRYFCDEELRLNRRTAPDLYLDVVPITGAPEQPRVDGSGPPFEYAVRMTEFGRNALLSLHVLRGDLSNDCLDRLAERVADFHRSTTRAGPDSAWGTCDSIARAVEENMSFLCSSADQDEDRSRLDAIRQWSGDKVHEFGQHLAQRREAGFIRECHGDLHLANLALIGDEAVPFDCIEFNPELRWIDIVSEIAFLTMDLEAHGARRLAYRFINRYEELSGDYSGLRLWTFYRCYRALVRAKVARLTGAAGSTHRARADADYRRYIALAWELVQPRKPVLIITHGPSGSGKSTVAGQLAENLGAIRIRSDIERKRLREATAEHEPYSEEITRRTYARLNELATVLLHSGLSVIIDATFLNEALRHAQRTLAEAQGIPFRILDVDAPEETLRARILARRRNASDPSDATLEVLGRQLRGRRALAPEERPFTVTIDGSDPAPAEVLEAVTRSLST